MGDSPAAAFADRLPSDRARTVFFENFGRLAAENIQTFITGLEDMLASAAVKAVVDNDADARVRAEVVHALREDLAGIMQTTMALAVGQGFVMVVPSDKGVASTPASDAVRDDPGVA